MSRGRCIAAVLGLALAALVLPARAHENTVVHRGLAHWSVDILGNPFFTATYRAEIGNGSDNEDVPFTRSLGHFYNPQTNSAPWFALGSGPATTNSQTQYDAALSEYANNNLVGTDAAFHRLGRALHFIQDMTSPAHTHDDDHATGDDFEGWGPSNFPAMSFVTVSPKYAVPPTAEGFVKEIARVIYDQTVYQAVLYESSSLAQPASVLKQMFPSVHFESGGFFFDNHFAIDRIGEWGCDLLCNDDWWIPSELLTTDNGGPGGVKRHTGAAYIENSGGDGGPVVPLVFGGQPNSANESLLEIYGRLFYPEAIAYGAGLLQVFADAVGAPLPTATSTATATRTATVTAPPTATHTLAPTATATATGTASHTATRTATRTATATATGVPSATATRTVTATASATGTPSATASPSASATGSATDPPTPTATPTPLCGATPRSGCGTPAMAGRSGFQVRNSNRDSRDKLQWRWSRGDALPAQLGNPTGTTEYALCVYDRSGGVAALAHAALVPGGGQCAGVPCWRGAGSGFRYKDRSASADGVQLVLLKPGLGHTGKLQVKGRGDRLALPPAASAETYFFQDPALTVQLVNSLGFCWEATFSAPAQKHGPELFKDTSD